MLGHDGLSARCHNREPGFGSAFDAVREAAFSLSGSALNPPWQVGKNSTNHGGCYDPSNDCPNCFAGFAAGSGPRVKVTDCRV
jgi:hypothetical protein